MCTQHETYRVADDEHGVLQRLVPWTQEPLWGRHRPELAPRVRLGDHNRQREARDMRLVVQLLVDDLRGSWCLEGLVVVARDRRALEVDEVFGVHSIEDRGAVTGDSLSENFRSFRPGGGGDERAHEEDYGQLSATKHDASGNRVRRARPLVKIPGAVAFGTARGDQYSWFTKFSTRARMSDPVSLALFAKAHCEGPAYSMKCETSANGRSNEAYLGAFRHEQLVNIIGVYQEGALPLVRRHS